jgi:hypothetical protein
LAGVLDGDGNFDIRKTKNGFALKAVRVKLHTRDLRILTHIKDGLKCGRILTDKSKPHVCYVVSDRTNMEILLNRVNGLIKIKIEAFKQACFLYNIVFKEPNYMLDKNDSYFAGLIDTDGSIVFNANSNRIECNLELKYNMHSAKLNFDNLIIGCKPMLMRRVKKNQTPLKKFNSIAFKYQTVNSMLPLYDYFMQNRLYSDFKFYRISKIKKFMEIRHFHKCTRNTPE